MLANDEKLVASINKSLGIVQVNSPPSHQTPLRTKRPKPCKTFPVHEQIEWVVYDWKMPERIFLLQKSLLNSIQL